jgi:hypothetical protein
MLKLVITHKRHLRSVEETESTAAYGCFDTAYYTYKIVFFFWKTDDDGDELQTRT